MFCCWPGEEGNGQSAKCGSHHIEEQRDVRANAEDAFARPLPCWNRAMSSVLASRRRGHLRGWTFARRVVIGCYWLQYIRVRGKHRPVTHHRSHVPHHEPQSTRILYHSAAKYPGNLRRFHTQSLGGPRLGATCHVLQVPARLTRLHPGSRDGRLTSPARAPPARVAGSCPTATSAPDRGTLAAGCACTGQLARQHRPSARWHRPSPPA